MEMCDISSVDKIGERQTGERVEYGDYACLGPKCALDKDGGYTVHMDDGDELPTCPRCKEPTGWVKF